MNLDKMYDACTQVNFTMHSDTHNLSRIQAHVTILYYAIRYAFNILIDT